MSTINNRTTSGPFTTSTNTSTTATTASTTTPAITAASALNTYLRSHPNVIIDRNNNNSKSIGKNTTVVNPYITTPTNTILINNMTDQHYWFKLNKIIINKIEIYSENSLKQVMKVCFGGKWFKVCNVEVNKESVEQFFQLKELDPIKSNQVKAAKMIINRWDDPSNPGSTVLLELKVKKQSGELIDVVLDFDTHAKFEFTSELLDKLQGRIRRWGQDDGWQAIASTERALPIPENKIEDSEEISKNSTTKIKNVLPYDRLNPLTWVPALPVVTGSSRSRSHANKDKDKDGSSKKPSTTSNAKSDSSSRKVPIKRGTNNSANPTVGTSVEAIAVNGVDGMDVEWQEGSAKSKGIKGKGKGTLNEEAEEGDNVEGSRKGKRIRKSTAIEGENASDYDDDEESDTPVVKRTKGSAKAQSSYKASSSARATEPRISRPSRASTSSIKFNDASDDSQDDSGKKETIGLANTLSVEKDGEIKPSLSNGSPKKAVTFDEVKPESTSSGPTTINSPSVATTITTNPPATLLVSTTAPALVKPVAGVAPALIPLADDDPRRLEFIRLDKELRAKWKIKCEITANPNKTPAEKEAAEANAKDAMVLVARSRVGLKKLGLDPAYPVPRTS